MYYMPHQFHSCTYYVNIHAHLSNHCHGKASITYSKQVFVVIVIQHAKCMCHSILSSVACLTLQHFSTLSHKWQIFGKQCWTSNVCFVILYNFLSETFLILRIIQQDIINYIGLQVKYPLFLSKFKETIIFLTDFLKILKYQILSSGSQAVPCGQTDRQTWQS